LTGAGSSTICPIFRKNFRSSSVYAISYSQLVSTDMFTSTVKRSPLCTDKIVGALTLPIFITILEAANFFTTAHTKVSMPCKLPSLESMGTLQIMRKLARGEIPMYSLLLGVRYGSAGETITLFAIMVGGGKLKVE
jgi:hypothetical protein